jgi:hypothetical protein
MSEAAAVGPDFADDCDNSATTVAADSCTLLSHSGAVGLASDGRSLCVTSGSSHSWPNAPGGEATMPILLWYLPFTMFTGTCDLVFSEFETLTAGERHVEFGEPLQDVEEPA